MGPGRKGLRLGGLTAALVGAALTLPLLPAAAAPAPLTVTIAQTDGTAAFDTDDDAGHDSSATNGIVRTNDTLTYALQVGTGTAATTNTTISLSLPQGLEAATLPSWCLTGGTPSSAVSPASQPAPGTTGDPLPITSTSWQRLSAQTITCNLGTVPASTVRTYSLSALVRPELLNGTSLTVAAKVTADGGASAGSKQVNAVVSARARFAVTLNGMAAVTAPNTGWFNQYQHPCTGDSSRACWIRQYAMLVTVPGGAKGVSPAAGPIAVSWDLSPAAVYGSVATSSGLDWTNPSVLSTYAPRLAGCYLTTNTSGIPDGRANLSSATTAVRDSGSPSCTPTGAVGSTVTVSLSNTDTTAYTSPTRSLQPDAPLVRLDRAYVASIVVYVDIPVDAVIKLGVGGTNLTQVTTAVSAPSLTDIGGRANDPSADTASDRTRSAGLSLSSLSGIAAFGFAGAPWNPNVTPASNYTPGWQIYPGPVGSSSTLIGYGVVVPGEESLAVLTLGTSVPPGLPGDGRVSCVTWDNTLQNLRTSNQTSTAGWISSRGAGMTTAPNGSAVWVSANGMTDKASVGFTAEYAHIAAPGAATSACWTAGTTWYANPSDVPGNDPTLAATGVYTAVNQVRTYAYLAPGLNSQNLFVAVDLQARGTTLTGDTLPIGTRMSTWTASAHHLASGVGTSAGATRADVLANPQVTVVSTYNGSGAAPSGSYGDRVILGAGAARLSATTFDPATNSWGATTPMTQAGATVSTRFTPSLVAGASSAQTPNVAVEACLPTGLQYTSATPAAAVVQTGSPTGAGLTCASSRQYVRWNLGQQPVNATLPTIRLDALVSMATPNGSATLTGLVSADWDISTAAQRTATAGFWVNSPASMLLTTATGTPVVDATPAGAATPRTLSWDVAMANAGALAGIGDLDVVDLLPRSGTGGSSFAGKAVLSAVTAGTGVVVWYTSDPAVSGDPTAATNRTAGSTTWCTAASGGTVASGAGTTCPTAPGAVTAVRLRLPGSLPVGGSLTATVQVQVSGNAGGDVYVDTTQGAATGLAGTLGPVSSLVTVTAASIGDLVWLDLDGDGARDTGEPGVADVPVSLSGTDSLGNAVTASTATSSAGSWRINGLPAGRYTVHVDGRGSTFSPQRAGTDPHVSSAVDASGNASVTVAQGAIDLDEDAGLLPASIGDLVFDDANGNGLQDAAGGPSCTGESGIAGVAVSLTGTDVLGHAVAASTTTDGAGHYGFTGLVAGTYSVTVATPSGWQASPTLVGADRTVDSDGPNPAALTLVGARRQVSDLDVGFTRPYAAVRVDAQVSGTGAGRLPVGATTRLTWTTCSASGTLDVPLTGATVSGPSLPPATPVRFTEQLPAAPAGTSWAESSPPDPLTTTTGTSTVHLTHQLVRLTGTFTLSAQVVGTGAWLVGDAPLRVGYRTDDDGVSTSGTLEVPADGTPVTGPTLGDGTQVSFDFVTTPTVAHVTFGDLSLPDDLTVGDGTSTPAVVTATATRVTGTFQVTATVAGTGAALVPADAQATVRYRWSADGASILGTLALPLDGSPATSPALPEGAVVDVLGVDAPAVAHVDWSTGTSTTLTIDGARSTRVDAALTATRRVGDVQVTVSASGDGVDWLPAASTSTVHWTSTDPDHPGGTLDLPATGGTATVSGLTEGTVLTLGAIDEPGADFLGWTVADPPAPALTVTDGTTVAALVPATVQLLTGTFDAQVQVDGDCPGGDDGDVTVVYSATVAGRDLGGRLDVPAGGSATVGPLPLGTQVHLDDVVAAPVPGCTWHEPRIDPADLVVAAASSTVAVRLSLTADTGTFEVTSRVDGTGVTLLPAGSLTTVAWTATLPSGGTASGRLEVPVGGRASGPRLPAGSRLSLLPADPPAVEHAQWGIAIVSPADVVIATDTVASVAIDRPLATVLVHFSVRVVCASPPSSAAQLTIPVHYATTTGLTGTISAPLDGTPATSPALPEGSDVTLTLGDVAQATGGAVRTASLASSSIVLGQDQQEVVAQVLADDHPARTASVAGTGDAALASTGADVVGLLVAAGALVGLGVTLLIARRRPPGRHARV